MNTETTDKNLKGVVDSWLNLLKTQPEVERNELFLLGWFKHIYTIGYDEGTDEGFREGFNDGEEQTRTEVKEEDYAAGFRDGYEAGYDEACKNIALDEKEGK